jgi:hypothetical protein
LVSLLPCLFSYRISFFFLPSFYFLYLISFPPSCFLSTLIPAILTYYNHYSSK